MLEVSRKQTVKTRRKHECFGCIEMIDKGDAAVYVSGKEDGKHVNFHLHVKCHVIAMKQKLFVEGLIKGELQSATVIQNNFNNIADTSYPF